MVKLKTTGLIMVVGESKSTTTKNAAKMASASLEDQQTLVVSRFLGFAILFFPLLWSPDFRLKSQKKKKERNDTRERKR